MKWVFYHRILVWIIAGGLLTPPFLALAREVVAPRVVDITDYRRGEVLVKLKDNSEVLKFNFSNDAPIIQIAADYSQNPDVEYAEPNYIYSLSAFEPNDVYYPQQWHLRQIGAPLAWEVTTGSPDVVVAVLDSGVDINHPDLKQNIWTNPSEIAGDGADNDANGYIDDTQGWDFVDNLSDPRPDAAPPYSRTALHHGTVVAGIIAAVGNNVEGVAGVAWRTRIMPLRVLDRQGQGDVEDVARAVEYATNNGASIINLSFVGTGASQRLEAALARAYAAGVLIVVAAGNSDESGGLNLDTSPRYPICYDVNSTQVYDLQKNLSEAYGGGWSGTTLAAPTIAGAAALIRAQNRKLSPAEVAVVLMDSADSIVGVNRSAAKLMGRGRLNVARALKGASTPGIKPPQENVAEGSRLITMPASVMVPEVRIFTLRGEIKSKWLSFDERGRVGGSVAISEAARLKPEDNRKVKLSGIIRGEQTIVVGEGSGGRGRVRTFDVAGNVQSQWYAFDEPFKGGVIVAAGDIYGTGESSVVVAPMSQGGPQIRIFEKGGRLRGQFFAYDKKLRGGFSVAVADIDGDKKSEIIVSSTTQYLPVRVFKNGGELVSEWFPYPTFKGGINVAAGDLDGSGIANIVTAPVVFGGPQIMIFDGVGHLLGQFMVLDSKFRGGINLAIGDTDGDGKGEIAIGPASRGGPQVRLFTPRGKLLGQFLVYDEKFRGGVRLAIMR
ncbi:MAG: peptidase S8 and S53, subtilisin, kexin, sedolisin [Parcubacteria group bacterium GW2011_GWA2_46_9]|nr:MAG: peptidase S8 and S53, subtilisin, kexin, sedolisin [Parcubacteria group bacterium GW2011_GWA2_46_9]